MIDVNSLAMAISPTTFAKRMCRETGMSEDIAPHQRRIMCSTGPGFLMVNVTRQGGKTTFCSLKALHQAIYIPKTTTIVVSKTERQACITIEKIRQFLKHTNCGKLEKDTAGELQLPNGSVIKALPGDRAPDSTRGRTANLLIEDEAQAVHNDIFTTCNPFLATTGGLHIMLFTPPERYSDTHHVYRMWHQYHGDDITKLTVSANECPWISPKYIDTYRQANGDTATEREFFNVFPEKGGGLLALKAILGITA